MGNSKGVDNVPPKQFAYLKKKYKHLSSRELKVKWARIQKATKGPLLELKNKLTVKSGSKKNINFPRVNDIYHKLDSEVTLGLPKLSLHLYPHPRIILSPQHPLGLMIQSHTGEKGTL